MCQTLLIHLRINPSEMLIPFYSAEQLSWDQAQLGGCPPEQIVLLFSHAILS